MRNSNFSKEHVKLYKSKKNWVAATIFTTSLGISGAVLIGEMYMLIMLIQLQQHLNYHQ